MTAVDLPADSPLLVGGSMRALAVEVAAREGVTFEQIAGATRGKMAISRVRDTVMLALSRKGFSASAIGRLLGGRNHSTICAGIERAKAREASAERLAA